MAEVTVGSAVRWKGETWRVVGHATGLGGPEERKAADGTVTTVTVPAKPMAQLDNLDRDAAATAPAADLEPVPLDAAGADARVAAREARMAPERHAGKVSFLRRRVARFEAEGKAAAEKGDKATAAARAARVAVLKADLAALTGKAGGR